MFCKKCGKELPDEARFCNHCGADQSASPHAKKAKKKRPLRIILAIVAVAACFVIGYFATGADRLKVPTPFDTPDSFDFGSSNDAAGQEKTEDSTESYVGETTLVPAYNDNEGRSIVTYTYRDGRVFLIRGTMYSADLIDADEFKNDAETAKARLEGLKAGDSAYLSSSINISADPQSDGYRVEYVLARLDEDQNMAELTAEFMDCEAENGVITEEAFRNARGPEDQVLRGSGYKHFQLKGIGGENDSCDITLYYEEDSIYVRRVRYEVSIHSDVDGYADIVSKNTALEEKSRQSASADLITIGTREGEWDSDYFWSYMEFDKLNEGNPEAVSLAAQCFDLPVQDGFLLVVECGQFLQDNGFEMIEENETSWRDREI
ncbi:MAG: zinc ribbon domain-containing protein [Eubacteriales bacterium]|nr:zinc ribbon domain-containing protein [Eubacteriales bacterium]